MSVVVVGLNHRSAPLDVLERMTIAPSGLVKALADLRARDTVTEAVVLSTCNRVEIYAVCETFHGAVSDIHLFLSSASGLAPSAFVDHLDIHFDATPDDTDVAEHLFTVASGLDSAVVGESEILGQIRAAWDVAVAEGACGPRLGALFRHAIETGKRARTETAIARGTASVSQAAVELAVARLGAGPLADRSVLVLGTGDIGVSMVNALQHAGVGEVFVANRTWSKAAALAAKFEGTAVPLHELPAALQRVDVLLTATSASEYVLGRDDVAEVMNDRSGRPLLIVDAALPRDIDPSAASIAGVTLLDLEAIRRFVDAGLEGRRGEIDSVRAIVEEECERFRAGSSARQVAPVVTALRAHFEETRLGELARYEGRLAHFSPDDRQVVEALTRQLLAKLLHDPTVHLKEAAGTPRGQRMADALRSLFDL